LGPDDASGQIDALLGYDVIHDPILSGVQLTS